MAPAIMAATRASSPLLIMLLIIIQLNLIFHLSGGSSIITAAALAQQQPADEQQQNTTTTNTKQQPALLVRSTCNSTSFYDLCVAALAADPSSATADVPGLGAIAVSAAAANASGTAAFLGNATATAAGDAAAAATPAADADYRALLRACAGKYAAARDALLEARASLAGQAYDYAFVHVSAAGEYPAVCRTLFRRRQQQQQRGASRASYTYPPELATREEALRRLCTIALDIISLLQNQET